MKNNSIRYPLVLCFCLSILGSSACSSPPLLGEAAPASSVANAGRGKLAMNFNLGDSDFQQINASDFIEVKSFHTQAAITDVARVRISLTSEKLSAPVTRDVTRNEINNSAIVINDLPVGPIEVSISLLDAQGGNLASEQKLVKVAADKITPVEFNLTLINEVGGQTDSPAEASTGGLAISINVKEETRIYGRVAISQPVVQVGEPVKIRVEEVQGDIAQFNFDLGNGSATKAQDTSILEEQTFSQPGVYQVQTKLKDSKGDTFVTAPVPIKVVAASSAKPVTSSVSYQPKVTVKSSLTSLPIALQGQGTFDQNGEGFPPNIAVKLYFQRPDQGVYDPVPKTTDGSGRFTHKWSPSATAQIGTYSFWATYSDNGQTRETAKVTYRVDAAKATTTSNSSSMKVLNVALLGQRESAWAKQPLGTCKSETIGSDGCTITSVAMVFNYHGISTDPSKLNQFLTKNAGYASGCLLSWGTLKKASQNILTDREINQSDVSKYVSQGKPVVAKLVGYLAYEHWVVIIGIQEDGKYQINDPWDRKTTSVSPTLAKKFHVLVK